MDYAPAGGLGAVPATDDPIDPELHSHRNQSTNNNEKITQSTETELPRMGDEMVGVNEVPDADYSHDHDRGASE